jgi:hypothetical protein
LSQPVGSVLLIQRYDSRHRSAPLRRLDTPTEKS